jgi:hypothetical protein
MIWRGKESVLPENQEVQRRLQGALLPSPVIIAARFFFTKPNQLFISIRQASVLQTFLPVIK